MLMVIMPMGRKSILKYLHLMDMITQDSNITAEEQRLIEMDERIDSYLRGQMTYEEENQFLSECKENKELKERAYMIALLAKSLKK
jgi:hypothetical protein